MDTPATWSMGIPASMMASIIPTWAIPRAPPPPKTRPTDVPVKTRPVKEMTFPENVIQIGHFYNSKK